MSYHVKLSSQAFEDLQGLRRSLPVYRPTLARDQLGLTSSVQRQIGQEIDSLASGPRAPGYRHLEHKGHLYCAQCGYYRILYRVEDEVSTVIILRIGCPQEGYHRLPPGKAVSRIIQSIKRAVRRKQR